jgi:DNA-binding NarL/FixJ family response regulator
MVEVRVAVDDGNEIFRRGVTACLADEPGLVVVPPDAVELHVLVASRAAAERARPGLPVVVCSDDADLNGVGASAAAVLPRAALSVDQLIAAVRAAAAGLRVRSAVPSVAGRDGPMLADRELAVLRCLADGMATRDISVQLGYSERTIKATIARACDRLGTRTRAQAVAESYRLHLL